MLTHGAEGHKCDVAASYFFFSLFPLESKIKDGSCESDEAHTGQPDGAAERKSKNIHHKGKWWLAENESIPAREYISSVVRLLLIYAENVNILRHLRINGKCQSYFIVIILPCCKIWKENENFNICKCPRTLLPGMHFLSYFSAFR